MEGSLHAQPTIKPGGSKAFSGMGGLAAQWLSLETIAGHVQIHRQAATTHGADFSSLLAKCVWFKMKSRQELGRRFHRPCFPPNQGLPQFGVTPTCHNHSTMSNRWAPPLWRAASAARAPHPARACASAAALPARVGVVGCGQSRPQALERLPFAEEIFFLCGFKGTRSLLDISFFAAA